MERRKKLLLSNNKENPKDSTDSNKVSQINGNIKNQFHLAIFTITTGNLNFYSKIFIKYIYHYNKKHEIIRYKSNKILLPSIYWKLQETNEEIERRPK